MEDFKDVKIIDQVLCNDLGEKVGKIAIIFCIDTKKLKKAVAKYCGDVPCNLFVDITLTNPWTIVIISGINKLDYHPLGSDLDAVRIMRERNQKIKEILG
jgi:hypothetical protein